MRSSLISRMLATQQPTPKAPARVYSKESAPLRRSDYVRELGRRRKVTSKGNLLALNRRKKDWVKRKRVMLRELREAEQRNYTTAELKIFQQYKVPLAKVRSNPEIAAKMLRRNFNRSKIRDLNVQRRENRGRLREVRKSFQREQLDARRQQNNNFNVAA